MTQEFKNKDYVRPAEVEEQDLYHGHGFIQKWIFCQDAKVIGVQYFSVIAKSKHQ